MRGVSRDEHGLRAYVKVGRIQREKRFPLGTPTHTLKAWRDDTRNALRKTLPPRGGAGSLQADVTKYLALVSAMPTHAERTRQLHIWVRVLGPSTLRTAVDPSDIRRILHDWRSAGLAAATCNKRRTALMHLWSVLDGKGARNPVRDVPRFKVDDPLPRGKDPHAIDRKLLKAPRCRTRAVLRVLLWTGMRPIELSRAQPDDLSIRSKTLIIRTAKGGRTRIVPLAPQALSAFTEYDWDGVPSAAPMNRLLKKWTGMTLRVYDLRHSYGTALAARETRLDVIGALMGHSTLDLTRRYTLAAASASAKAATLKLAAK